MDVLDEAAQQQVFAIGIPAQARAQEEEQGPNAFSPAAQDVRGDGIHQIDLGVEVPADEVLNLIEVAPIGLPNVRHGQRGGDCGTFSHHARDTRVWLRLKSSKAGRHQGSPP